MPEGYTHIRTAQRAAAAVRYKIKCPAAFAAGANGPDTFFCYQAWKPARKRLYDLPALGRRLHGEKTGPFLCSMVRHVRTVPQIEYTMGFLSHYAADTVVHPYVEALCRPGMPYARKGGHGYFEAALDTLLHEQDTGSGMVPAVDCAPALTGEALADIANLLHTCLQEVYELDVPVEYLADSFYYATRLRGLFTSRRGVRRAFYWLIEPFFAGRGYITGHVTPRKMKQGLPDAWTDPFSGEEHSGDIFALLAQAQGRSEKYMAATILAWGGQLSSQALADQLGSMSYLEGRSTAQSDPDYIPPEPTKKDEATLAAEAEQETGPEAAVTPETADGAGATEPQEAAKAAEVAEPLENTGSPEAAEELEPAGPPEEPGTAEGITEPDETETAAVEQELAEAVEAVEEAAADNGKANSDTEVPAPAAEPAAEEAETPTLPEASEPAAENAAEELEAGPAAAEPEPPPITVLTLPPEPPSPAPIQSEESEDRDAAPSASVSVRLKQMLLESSQETEPEPEPTPAAAPLPDPDPTPSQEGDPL